MAKKKKKESLLYKGVSKVCGKMGMTVPAPVRAFLDTTWSILLAGIAAIAIRVTVFEPYTIPSGSMIPTMLIGDYLYVHKSGYGISRYSFPFIHPSFIKGRHFIPGVGRMPKRGDVVVFKVPYDTDTNYIKRLIGMPGDRVQVKKGILHINGKPVPQRRIKDYESKTAAGRIKRMPQFIETLDNGKEYTIIREGIDGNQHKDNTQEFVVPEGHYFMMGDNRNNSGDSRGQLGTIPFEKFVGPAKTVIVSVDSSILDIWKLHKIRLNRFFKTIN